MLIVQKFGGSSLKDTGCIQRAADRCIELHREGHGVVVVVSAQGDSTDEMIEKANSVNQNPSRRELDAFLSAGEQMSAGLMTMALEAKGYSAVSLTGWQAGLFTDSIYGNARVQKLTGDRIKRELDSGKIVVVAGFQGINAEGDITTLGRGGSDTTAVALAACLKADVCRIYTDVDGVYDKDPRKHSDAVKFSQISYADMLKLAREGARVLHDRCVELASQYKVPVEVLSSFRPGPGTMVIDIQGESTQN